MRSMHKPKKLYYCFVLLFFSSTFALFGQDVLYPESSGVRENLVATWFMQDISVLREQNTEIFQNELGEYFLVRCEEKDGLMEIILAPLVLQTVDVQDFSIQSEGSASKAGSNSSTLTIETWPKDGLGSIILYRDVITGKNVKIRYYFMNDREVFLDFFPGKEKSYANFSIFGALVAHNAPVPVPFEYFFTASLNDIQKLTKNILPWKYVDVTDTVYADSIQMVQVIRKYLPDAQKAKMFLSDTSEYDFLRWIIDGLVFPLTGGRLYEEPLFVPTVEPDFMIPERQNTHKSFDFVRNLAAASISAGTSLPYTYNSSNADVKIEPFSVITNSDGITERVNFVTDVGYQISVIKPLLYLLTATEEDLFYLGAIRELKTSSEGGRNSEQYYYNNAAAFFSWFDSNGMFHVSVFENGAEFTLDQFIDKYENAFVYLVKVKPSVNFFPEEPPVIEEENILENADQ